MKKNIGINDLLGFALGCVGMSMDDFCRCTPDEFWAVCQAYRHRHDTDYRDARERTRMLAAITIQPHVIGKLTPRKLLPFPWEKREGQKKKTPLLSAAESKARFEKLARRVNCNGDNAGDGGSFLRAPSGHRQILSGR